MSTNEPTWPTEDEALAQWRRKRDYYTDDSPGMVRCAIDMCRAAWLAANDDPSQSPVGEVRQRVGLATVVATDRAVTEKAELGRLRWFVLVGAVKGWNTASYYYDSDVKSWPVIGTVPGSPAAEAQQ